MAASKYQMGQGGPPAALVQGLWEWECEVPGGLTHRRFVLSGGFSSRNPTKTHRKDWGEFQESSSMVKLQEETIVTPKVLSNSWLQGWKSSSAGRSSPTGQGGRFLSQLGEGYDAATESLPVLSPVPWRNKNVHHLGQRSQLYPEGAGGENHNWGQRDKEIQKCMCDPAFHTEDK